MKKIAIGIFSFLFVHNCLAETMRVYALYTDSHKELVDTWFMPHLPHDIELVLEHHQQDCKTGNFMDNGWMKTMIKKVDLVIRAIGENWGQVFVHSDVDVQFFQSISQEILSLMEGYDMAIQKDAPNGVMCAGFFACRGNERTLKFWSEIKRLLLNNDPRNDQCIMNDFLLYDNRYQIKWRRLPVTYLSGGTLTGRSWQPGASIPVPENIKIHHANWTVGNENKMKQLKYVRTIVQNRSAENKG